MNKRRILAVLIAFVLTVAATAMWSASTIQREGDPDAIVLEDSGADAGNAEQPKKKGNKVVKVLAAPFKMFGRLFGGGDDTNKVHRMTEKDAERFESAGVTRIEDANNKPVSATLLCLRRKSIWKPVASTFWKVVIAKPSANSRRLRRSIRS